MVRNWSKTLPRINFDYVISKKVIEVVCTKFQFELIDRLICDLIDEIFCGGGAEYKKNRGSPFVSLYNVRRFQQLSSMYAYLLVIPTW